MGYQVKKFILMQGISLRPPQLRCIIFRSIHLPYLHSIPSDSYWALVCLATLPDIPCLIYDFCSSDQSFALRLPSDSISRWTPLSSAIRFPLSGYVRDFHPLDYAHAGHTKKSRKSFSDFLLNVPIEDRKYKTFTIKCYSIVNSKQVYARSHSFEPFI